MTNVVPLPEFETLSRLFRGDKEKVRRVLDAFVGATRAELPVLDAAHARGNVVEMIRVIRMMKFACLQIGENTAAEAALAVESAVAANVDAHVAFAAARDELRRALERVERYLVEGN